MDGCKSDVNGGDTPGGGGGEYLSLLRERGDGHNGCSWED